MRRRRRERLTDVRAGLLALAVVSLAVWLGFTKNVPFYGEGHELKAAFTTAHQLKPNSPVRIAGVQVGKVKEVKSLGDKGALVTMEIQDKGLPIKSDAQAKIRPRIFLEGNYFVDVLPGSPSARNLEEGATIPITQTASPVGFGRLLEVLQSDTREDLRSILQELGTAFSKGGSQGFNRALRYLEPAFKNSAIAADATRGQLEHDLSEYIEHAGTVAEGLDRDPEALKSLVTNFAQVADALASQDVALNRAIGLLDDTLIQGRSAFGKLNAAFPPLRRLVADLRPATRAARPALDAQLKLVPELRKLVSKRELLGLTRDLRPVVPELAELNRGSVALQEQTRLLSSCQNNVIIPTTNEKVPDSAHPPVGPAYEDGVKWMPGIAGESRAFDANGQYIKILAHTANYAYALGSERFLLTQRPLMGVNPPKAPGVPPLRSDVPCETQERPDLRTVPGDPPRAIKVNRNTAAYRAQSQKALARSLKWMRGQLKREGLDKLLSVSKKPLERSQLDDLRRPFK